MKNFIVGFGGEPGRKGAAWMTWRKYSDNIKTLPKEVGRTWS
jgi:hypothetical protein